MVMIRGTARAAAVASLGHGPIAVEHQRLGGGLCLNHQRLKLDSFPVNTDFFESSLKGRDSELVEPVLTLLHSSDSQKTASTTPEKKAVLPYIIICSHWRVVDTT